MSFFAPDPHPAAGRADEPGAAPATHGAAPRTQLPAARLPARQALADRRGDLFTVQSWTPPAPPPLRAAAAPPPAPDTPPNPYRFAGTAHYGDGLKAVLAAGNRVYAVGPGERLGDYKVLSVTRSSVTLLYTPLGVEQQVAFARDAALEAALAQLQRGPPASGTPRSPAASPFPRGSPLAVR